MSLTNHIHFIEIILYVSLCLIKKTITAEGFTTLYAECFKQCYFILSWKPFSFSPIKSTGE